MSRNRVQLVDDPLTLQNPTDAGKAREIIAAWLIGYTMDSMSRNDETGLQTLTLTKGQRSQSRILWNARNAVGSFTPPATWHVKSVRRLNGDVIENYNGAPESIGPEPVLFETDTMSLPRMVAHYTFDEAANSSQISDSADFDNTATLLTPQTDTLGITGRMDGALSFGNGSALGKGATAPTKTQLRSKTFSAALWIRPTAGFSDYNTFGQKVLVSHGDFAQKQGFQLLGNLDNTLSLGIYDGLALNQLTVPMPPVTQWTHVVATYDGTTLQLFFNGALQAAKVISRPMLPLNTGELIIGRYFKGEIDDVKLYNYGLSTDEVGALSSIASRYRFEQATTSAITDSTARNAGALVSSGVDAYVADSPDGTSAIAIGQSGESYGISVPDSASLRASKFTVMSWIRPRGAEASASNTDRTLIGKSDFALKQGFNLTWTKTGKIALRIYDGVSFVETSAPLHATDQWVHVAGTYDGVQLKLYVNGDLVGSTASSTTMVVSSSALSIGRYFSGDMDDVQIYVRSLGQASIREVYQNGSF